MKKLIIFLLACLLLTGCRSSAEGDAAPPDSVPDESQSTQTDPEPEVSDTTETITAAGYPLTVYLPNDNADGFVTEQITLDAPEAQLLVKALIDAGVLNDNIQLISMEIQDNQLNLDFNGAFLDQLVTYGTAGEHMMVGSVVNTFLSAFGADYVMITTDGQIMESGHVIYDFPMEFFQ